MFGIVKGVKVGVHQGRAANHTIFSDGNGGVGMAKDAVDSGALSDFNAGVGGIKIETVIFFVSPELDIVSDDQFALSREAKLVVDEDIFSKLNPFPVTKTIKKDEEFAEEEGYFLFHDFFSTNS